jgi:ABC-type multidrug transport system fused ATPase/permease subunit
MKDNKPFALFLRYAGRHKRSILWLTLVYAVSTALLVLAPQTLSRFIDSVHNGQVWQGPVLAILLYLAAMLAQSAMAAVLDYSFESVGQRFTDDFRHDILSHYLALNSQQLSSLTSGEMLTRLNEDPKGLFRYFFILFYKLAGSALALMGILAALFMRAGWLSAVFLVVSIFAILGFKRIQDRGIPKYVRQAKASAAFNSLMKEILDSSPSLRGLNAENYAETQTRIAMKQRFKESFPANLMYANLWCASTIMEGIMLSSGLLISLLLWDSGSISLGVVYLIYTYCDLIISPLQDFRNHMGNMQGAWAGILRSRDFLNLPVTALGGNSLLNTGALELEVKGLHFSYEGSGEVLRGVNFTVPAGGRVGIMGETGCGKSTLLTLIARLNSFEHGLIRLGGEDICAVNSQNFRSRVAYCTQRVQLVHGTLRDNISLFDEGCSDKEILDAVGLLGLTDWFDKFSHGLDTRLEMGEGNISSGEAQLIALIRLALHQSGLVLLDEISSNLDAATEKRIMQAVKALCEGRTVVAIAHRAEALDWMDRILRMDKGVLYTPENKEGKVWV